MTLGRCADPSAVEVRFQDPELLIDPARDVGVDCRSVCILDIRGECNVTPYRLGVGREALCQRQHMGMTIHEGVGILCQLRLHGPRVPGTGL